MPAAADKSVRKPLAVVLAEFAAGARFGDLPAQAIETAKTGIIDCIGVAVAGHAQPPVQILREELFTSTAAGAAGILGFWGRLRTTPANAAWINGTAGHVLDYDDIARGHPSVAIVPAILAVGEEINASGADLIAAYVVGYEVWMDLMLRERGSYQEKGWHHTPMLGAVAATAACANLQRLDAAQTTHAFGIAASQASGIVANHGTMMKSVQVGKTGHNAVLAARLARAGMTASPDALDDERGFLKAISPAGDVDLESPDRLGIDWHICKHGLSIKRYPVCYRAHRLIDATLGVLEREPLDCDCIALITASIGKLDATILLNHSPASGLAAKFSAEFAIACAMLGGNVGLLQVTDDFVRRKDVQDLMRKVRVVTNENYDPEAPGFSMYDQVRISFRDGRVVESEKVRHALGHPRRPLASAALKGKFLDCMAAGKAEIDGERMFQDLTRLESLTHFCGFDRYAASFVSKAAASKSLSS